MRFRLLNVLTLFSLLLCGATVLTACLAALFSNQRWTLIWHDKGSSIENRLHGIGWNGFGWGWADYVELIGPTYDPRGMRAVRNYLGAMTPPDQRYAIPSGEQERCFVENNETLRQHVNYSRWVTSAGDISFSVIAFLFALLPLVRAGAILIHRGRAASRAQSARRDPALTLTDRIDALATRLDERFPRYAHRRARCPMCSDLIPRHWAWEQSHRDLRCGNCYVLLRERPSWRRLGNLALIAAGWFATWLTVCIAAALLRRRTLWDVALSAMAVIPVMSAWAYVLYPYITRFDVTAPRCRHCDYNLTGTASTVCPECGHAVEFPEFVL